MTHIIETVCSVHALLLTYRIIFDVAKISIATKKNADYVTHTQLNDFCNRRFNAFVRSILVHSAR